MMSMKIFKKSCYIFSLFIYSCTCFAVSVSGSKETDRLKIPLNVGLLIGDHGESYNHCTVSLVNDGGTKKLLTAAHCFGRCRQGNYELYPGVYKVTLQDSSS